MNDEAPKEIPKEIIEKNKENMNNLENDLNKVIGSYLIQFLNKFDHFSNEIRIADSLLKGYEYRYEKLQEKLGNLRDINEFNDKNKKLFLQKIAKIPAMEKKMSEIEEKLKIINEKVDNILKKTNK